MTNSYSEDILANVIHMQVRAELTLKGNGDA